MCVIIHVPADKNNISKDILQKAYSANSHGWGIMWAEGGNLFTEKSTTSFKDFYKHWKEVPTNVERAIHFRIKTHGLINDENCHPFKIGDNLGLMHNGVIQTPLIDDKFSDTHNFSKYELPPLLNAWPTFMDDPDFVELMDEMTGWSKLLFMNSEGRVLKTRKNVWSQREGCDFSNTNGLYTYSGGYGSSYGGNSDTTYSATYDRNRNHREADNLRRTVSRIDNSDWRGSQRLLTDSSAARGPYRHLSDHPSGISSDLYSGGKTDQEGQEYVDNIELQRLQSIQDNYEGNVGTEDEEVLNRQVTALLNNQGNKFPRKLDQELADMEDDSEFDPLEHDPGIVVEQGGLADLSFDKMLEFVEDMPRSAALTIQSLIEQIGELELALDDKKRVSA